MGPLNLPLGMGPAEGRHQSASEKVTISTMKRTRIIPPKTKAITSTLSSFFILAN